MTRYDVNLSESEVDTLKTSIDINIKHFQSMYDKIQPDLDNSPPPELYKALLDTSLWAGEHINNLKSVLSKLDASVE